MITIQTISLTIVLFMALCAALHLWINRPRGLVAGEYIKRGRLVCLGEDGKIYNAAAYDLPLGFCIEE